MAKGTKPPKARTCPICSTEYTPRSTTQKVCHSYKCAIEFTRLKGEEKAAREKRKQERLQRDDLKRRRESLKGLSEWNREAQAAFNRYIRMRDLNKECVSCGSHLISNSNYLTGSAVDASHYRSRGAASHLKFNVFNVHSACTRCNRQLSGNAVEYRIRLIERIGLERVERLEQDNEARKFDIPYLKRVKAIFTRRARHYEKLRKRYMEAA
ncbi:recombination protein NinG [Chimaeribacter arupi]|uniref:recombination protein NinG n=1 Tax=Chimaeribacter arupi TaxID=2060066 RepID=UPI002712013A|nr:recombination protein NinG [Chimaeribacter arupi]WKZ94086.1 recombination protein NinG [Chimaeribacter arupi]